jgi:hypothetical protein
MTFYIGPEVNQTPAFSKRTLFVEDFQDTKIIESTAREYKTPHISLAAKNTFSLEYDWNAQLTALLDRGFMVTLEYPVELHSRLIMDLSRGVLQSRNFVPLPCVNVMSMSTLNPNLTLKIDDQSGEGVWAMHYHQIMDSNRYTAASEFQMEEVAPAVGAVPNPVLHIPIPDTKLKVAVPVVPEGVIESQPPAVDKNPQDLGLDPTAPSQLKPEAPEDVVVPPPVATTAAAAADLYAGDAKTDPLAAEASKKPVKKK